VAVVGFDAEFLLGEGSPCLLQLATVGEAFLVDLLALGASGALATALEAVLLDASVAKVGFDGANDLRKIVRHFPVLANACRGATPVEDVGRMEAERRSKELNISRKHASQGLSLSSVAEQVFGKPLDKSLQVCDWGCRPLSEGQKRYAALDAFVPAWAYTAVRQPSGAGSVP